MRLRLTLILVLLILVIHSCSEDEEINGIEILITDCENTEMAQSFFENAIDLKQYIEDYRVESDYYIITLNSGESRAIPISCIQDIEQIKDEASLSIQFESGYNSIIPYKNNIDYVYFYNQFNVNPLSATLIFDSQSEGQLKMKVLPKNSNGDIFEKAFDIKSGNNRIPLLGFYYGHENQIVLEGIAEDNTSYFQDTLHIQTEAKPNYIPRMDIVTANKSMMSAGMNLISYRERDNPSLPFLVDHDGEVRYVLDFTTNPELADLNYDVGMERLKNGNYYFGKWLSQKIYEVDILGQVVNIYDIAPFEFHHNVQEKEDGNLLVTVSRYDDHLNGSRAVEDWIIEIDRISGEIVHEWNLKESLDENRESMGWNVWQNLTDWAHANAVIHDPSDNTIIVSCRTQGLVKLDYNNNVVWILGNHIGWGQNRRGEDLYEFLLAPLDNTGNRITDQRVLNGQESHPDFEWNWYQHAPFIHPQTGDIYLFDNGDNRDYGSGGRYSRAVGYKIDPMNMTVQQIWDYGKERGHETYSRIVSDVDYLSDKNNILFCPGSRVDLGSGDFGAKIVEVDVDSKNVVFEMNIHGTWIVFHRADRLTLYPD